jgi:hypothetical protein
MSTTVISVKIDQKTKDEAQHVAEDWRAAFSQERSGDRLTITFRVLGTHKQLYG